MRGAYFGSGRARAGGVPQQQLVVVADAGELCCAPRAPCHVLYRVCVPLRGRTSAAASSIQEIMCLRGQWAISRYAERLH